MHRRYLLVFALGSGCVLLSGCPKGNADANLGEKAELNQNYDAALNYFQKAMTQDPKNTEWKLKYDRVRFEAGQYHYQKGVKYRNDGNLNMALAEFQKALSIDPSSPIAAEDMKKTADMIAAQTGAGATTPANPTEPALLPGPPKLAPLSHTPIDIPKMNANDKLAFQTIGKLAGVTVIFDPTMVPKPMTVELPNVTLEEALDIVALQSKTFWTPVASNVILVSDDNQNNRRAYEDEVFRTFYLSNTVTDQDLNDVMTALRNTIGATTQAHISPIKSLNAIVMRDTPDRVMLASRVIDAIDKAKPEVVVDVQVLEARRDLVRNLGINPGTSASLTFCPPSTSSTTTTGTSTTTTPAACTSNTSGLALNALKHLGSADFVANLPSATVTALLTDNTTKVLENPQVRSVDGEHAILKIGTRIPVATGSFQAGTGVGVSTAGTSLVNPLVNTQFQYQDVGVNVDLTPRIHGDRDVSLKIKVEISSVSGTQNIGGINQPIISQKSIDHDIRLKDGEVSVMGGLIERQDTNNLAGWPGFARIPLLHYLFSETDVEHEEDEVLIVLTPHVVRVPMLTAADLQAIETGTDANVQLRAASAQAPMAPPSANMPAGGNPPINATPASGAPATQPGGNAMVGGGQPALRFEPGTISVKPGDTATVGIVVQNAMDLFSIPILLQYNPAVISVEEVRHGGFLSGSSGEEALVQRIDQAHGQAVISASRTANLPGISGTGTLVGIVIKGIAPGDSKLSIVQVNARDSQQKPISFVTSEGSVHVQQ